MTLYIPAIYLVHSQLIRTLFEPHIVPAGEVHPGDPAGVRRHLAHQLTRTHGEHSDHEKIAWIAKKKFSVRKEAANKSRL